MQRTSFLRVAAMAALGFAAACAGDTPQAVNEETPVPPSLAPPTSYANRWNLTSGSPKTINGAIWTYPTPFKVGTGVLNPFLSIQADGDEAGFNTDGDFKYDQTRTNFTNPLPLNQVPVIKGPGGVLFREFIFDANEANSEPQAFFSIDKLDFWVCNTAAAKTYTLTSDFEGSPSTCVKVYFIEPFDGKVGALATDDSTSGSGKALDYQILIPDAFFVAPAGGGSISNICPYNPSVGVDCGYYLIVNARMGYFGTAAPPAGDPDYETGATFEEFSTIKRGYVQVSKTATTTYTRTYNWTIDKTVTPTTIDLWYGDNQNAAYSVLVTNTGYTDGGWAVSGNITITNPSTIDVVLDSKPTDVMTGGITATVDCGAAAFPYTLAGKTTLNCTYSSPLPDGTSRTNTVTVSLADLAVSTATAAVTFGAPTTEVNKTVNVTDLYPLSGGSTTALGAVTAGVNSPRTFSYNRNYACAAEADRGTKTNRATIVETGQKDDAEVTVNCYRLTVSKTAVPARATTYVWTIDKTVKKQADADAAYAASKSFAMITGDEAVARYRILLDRTVTSDVFSTTGVITILNPSASSGNVVVRNVRDTVLVSPTLAASIASCSGGSVPDGAAGNYRTLAPGTSFTCNYSATFPSDPGTGTLTNRATVQGAIPTNNTKYFSGSTTFTFSGVTPTVTGSPSVNLNDTYGGSLGSFSDDATVNYDKTFTCSNAGNNDNIASINTTPTKADTARVTINCYTPSVAKTATTSLTRKWAWKIDKFAGTNPGFVDGTLTLAVNQTYIFNYGVKVELNGLPVDSEWKTKGTITVANPSGQSVKLNSVTDAITGGFAPAVSNCKVDGGAVNPTGYTLASGKSMVCDWAETAMPDGTTRTNTVTAVKQHRRWTGDATATEISGSTANYTNTASVDFTTATVKKYDNCINVSDSPYGALGVVCESSTTPPAGGFTAPKTFNYQLPIGPYAACGPNSFQNTASFTSLGASTNATPVTGSDIFTVNIDIPCDGCTLTQGYWKTHNGLFGLKNGGRKGPPIHVFENTAWNDYAYWKFFGGTPAPVPAGKTAVPAPLKAAPTWYTTWVTPPKGDPYYNAAHQFMAAMANLGNGAGGLASIEPAIGQAYTFFLTALPGTAWTDEQRATLLGWNSLFGSYNEGLIGPGHCDEDYTSAP